MRSLRWRRHRHLLVLMAMGIIALVVVFGDLRIAAITSSEREAAEAEVTHNIAGTVDLFDDTVVHEISLTFDRYEYQSIIAAYREDEEKLFMQASATIDGTTIPAVGLRLKGNSTLMGLRPDGPFGRGSAARPMRPPSECVPPEVAKMFEEPQGTPVAGATPGAGQGPGPGRNPFGQNISADDPAGLPWLISFDEIIDGQRYQGLSDIAVRPVLANQSALNEALALKMVGRAGEPTQRAAYAAFSVNGSEGELRLILEVPRDAFAERTFDAPGVLYKSLSTGTFSYQGDDPTAYALAFDQETSTFHQDLKPLIDLLKWASGASDEAFAAELDQHIEVASLARYIALQEFLGNFDDMAGPGKNYYLWYNLESGKFTVLTWDLNLALSEMGGPGGPGGPGGRGPGEVSFDFEAMMSCVERVMKAEGREMENRMPRMGHPLKDRFLAAPEFQDLYAREYAAVYDALFGRGQAAAELDRLAEVVRQSGLLAPEQLETEVAAIRSKLREQQALGPRPAPSAIPGTPVAATPVAATPMPNP